MHAQVDERADRQRVGAQAREDVVVVRPLAVEEQLGEDPPATKPAEGWVSHWSLAASTHLQKLRAAAEGIPSEGATTIKIHGNYVPVRAEVAQLNTLSAHADREQLLAWLEPSKGASRIFVTHGEPVASDALRLAIEERYRTPVTVPTYLDQFIL